MRGQATAAALCDCPPTPHSVLTLAPAVAGRAVPPKDGAPAPTDRVTRVCSPAEGHGAASAAAVSMGCRCLLGSLLSLPLGEHLRRAL